MNRWREDLHPRRPDGQFGAGPAGTRQAARAARAAQVAGTARVATALPDGVETIPLAKLRAQIRYGTDGFDYESDKGWQEIMARQLENSTTAAFLADILRNGMQPIRVSTAQGRPLGDADEIRDGNHRLAAAMLLGVTDVPVTRRDLADDGGANKVPVTAGAPIGPLPPGAGAVLARARQLLALPDPGHRALRDAEDERRSAAYEARQDALLAEAEAEEERFAARRAARR